MTNSADFTSDPMFMFNVFQLHTELYSKYKGCRSLYEAFGVPDYSDYDGTIKPKWREKAWQYHPDSDESKKYPDAEVDGDD